MTSQPQVALNRLIAALESHAQAAQAAGDVVTPRLLEAEERLRDAFFTYDDELFAAYGVDLPFEIIEIDEDDEEFFDDDDDDDLDEDYGDDDLDDDEDDEDDDDLDDDDEDDDLDDEDDEDDDEDDYYLTDGD